MINEFTILYKAFNNSLSYVATNKIHVGILYGVSWPFVWGNAFAFKNW